MPLWTQHVLVLALVAVAAFVIVRGAIGTLKLRHGKIGSCCAKGCGAAHANSSPAERIIFLPAETLRKRPRSS